MLFLADVRVAENSYQKAMAATACSKTIITTNPVSREASALAQYAQNVELTNDERTVVPGEQTVDCKFRQCFGVLNRDQTFMIKYTFFSLTAWLE